MTDHRNPDSERLLAREQAPDHGPNFWSDLGAALDAEAPVVGAGPDSTALMPQISPQPTTMAPTTMAPAAQIAAPAEPPRRMWPLAAAAALIALVGFGFVALRESGDPAQTTEIVAAPSTVADSAPLDGPTNDGPTDEVAEPRDAGAANGEGEAVSGDTTTADPATGDSAGADISTDASAGEGEGDDGDTSPTTAGGAVDPTPAAVPAIPNFALAPGATGTPDFLPLDSGIPADGTFLADWPQRGLTWYAVSDPNASCVDAKFSEIRYVNAAGLTQVVRDPQLAFSGEISHFKVSNSLNRAAWVVGCGTQLELYVANLEPTGHIADLTLAWLGDGTISSALVMWDDDVVSLNAIEPGGTAFAVDYDVETELVSRNGGPSRIMLEAGAPAQRSLTPLAATPDGGLTYWAGTAPAGTVSECPALYGSGVSDTLWLRQGEGQWLLAADDFPMAEVTAAALDVDSLQIAFADVCDGEVGRVVIGSVLDDGRIAEFREIDLSPYVPGYAAQLFWVDDDTLRIETENTEFGVDPIRFDFRLTDGVIVQLD